MTPAPGPVGTKIAARWYPFAAADDLITDQEIAILCSVLDGRAANLNANKGKVLDRLIAHGFVELSERGASTYKLTVKAQKLLDDQGVGVSGG